MAPPRLMAPLQHGISRRGNPAHKNNGAISATDVQNLLTEKVVEDLKGSAMEPIGFNFTTGDANDNNPHAERHHRWINKQITSAAETGNITWLLQVVQANMDEMNLINFSTALHRVAKLALGSNACSREWIMAHETLRALQKAVVDHVALSNLAEPHAPHGDVSEMRCLSIICWSCATLRIREESLFHHMARISETRLSELKPFELSNMLWAFAKLSLGSKRFFDGMASSLMYRREGQFSPQCLSTLVWAFGTAKVHSPAVFTSVSAEISMKAHAMVPQGIANTVWAYARVQRQEAHLFHALAETAVKNDMIWTFKAQELSNIVWAFATVGLPHAQLFNRIAEVTIRRRFELPPQNVANMLWAYAKLMAEARVFLFPPLLQMATNRLETYKPQEVSAILWAAAKEAGCPASKELFMAVPQVFQRQLETFTSQALACMVEAFVLVEIDDDDRFFEAMLEESLSRIQTFQPPSLCTLFRGLAMKTPRCIEGRESSALKLHIKTITNQIVERLEEMQQHNLTHLQQSMGLFHPYFRPTELSSWISTDLALSSHSSTCRDAPDVESLSLGSLSGAQEAEDFSITLTAKARENKFSDVGHQKHRTAVVKRYQQNGQIRDNMWDQRAEEITHKSHVYQCDHAGLDEDGVNDCTFVENGARKHPVQSWNRYSHTDEGYTSTVNLGIQPRSSAVLNSASYAECESSVATQACWNEMWDRQEKTEGNQRVAGVEWPNETIKACADPQAWQAWKPPPMLALAQHLDSNAWQASRHAAFEPLVNHTAV